MKRLFLLTFILITAHAVTLMGQDPAVDVCTTCSKYLYWTGEQNGDFFNELNWREAVQLPSAPLLSDTTKGSGVKPACLPGVAKPAYQICLAEHDLAKDKYPAPGTINPGQPVKFNLYASHAHIDIAGDISFANKNTGLTIAHTSVNFDGKLVSGVLTLDSVSTAKFFRSTPLGEAAKVNFRDVESWVYFHEANPENVLVYTERLWVHGQQAQADQNIRINQYYQKGSVVRMKDLNYAPLTISSTHGLPAGSVALKEHTIYAGSAIPGGMNNRVSSFKLKRGYMATFAIHENGTGKSKVYIASEQDMVITEFPEAMKGKISFIRVLPWNWVTKKGTGGFKPGVDAGWYYNWGNTQTSRPNYEYVPMAWGAGAASPSSLKQIIAKDKITHLLGFNESDNCNDQSGQYFNLCKPEVAVAYYENLMGTGLRLGTPAPRENGPATWLRQFQQIAKERDVRFDFVAVHWYDWGGSPQNSPYADPQQIFNRFKAYLSNVYSVYGLPIWITEFNANPNRDNSVHAEFLKLALPYLEQLDYVERYAYFEPMSQYSSNNVMPSPLFDDDGNLTNIGAIYFKTTSTPSVPEVTYSSPNNLEGMDTPYTEPPVELRAFEAECGLYRGNKWELTTDSLASGLYAIRGNPDADGSTRLAEQVHFEFETVEEKTVRLWLRLKTHAGTNGSVRIRMDNQDFEVFPGMTSATYEWFRIPRYFPVSAGRHRLTIAFVNSGTSVDNVAMVNTSSPVAEASDVNTACALPSKGWGLEGTDVTFWKEAESGDAGNEWISGKDVTASSGTFVEPLSGVSATDTPPGLSGQIAFDFTIEKDDEYSIWAKVQSLTSESDAFWFSVDGEPFRKWDGLQNKSFQWKWNKLYFSEGLARRDFTYFLTQGQHRITIAYSEPGAKLDRLAVASTHRNPALEDPDVLLKDPVMSFEAEDAQLIGTAFIVNCITSSKGKQVNMGFSVNNGIRFNSVASLTGGNHRISFQYMSAVARRFRLFVNGADQGVQSLPASGKWCFEGGTPGVYAKVVTLSAGTNVIEIRPVGTEAPFIDKISLVREQVSLEAEEADLSGTVTVAPCNSSGSAAVNLGSQFNNSILFGQITVNATMDYYLDIHYITKVQREARLFINGVFQGTIQFQPSGGWCFEGGVPVIKTVERMFNTGNNTVEIKPTGTDAPFIDKIAILKIPAPIESLARVASGDSRGLSEEIARAVYLYPNPARHGEEITVHVPSVVQAEYTLRVIDRNGRSVYQGAGRTNGKSTYPLRLPAGMYLVVIHDGTTRHTQKLIVR